MKNYKPELILCNASWGAKKTEPPFLLAFFHGIKVGSYRGEDSGAQYPIMERRIDFVYDVSDVINEIIDGQPLLEYFWRIQQDGAITVPTSRHQRITQWLLEHDELLIAKDIMSDYECEY